MPAIDPRRTAERVRSLGGLASAKKGRAFEELTADLFATIPGCDLLVSRARDVAMVSEIDLGFRVSSASPVFSSFGGEMLIECKCLAEPVGPKEVHWFVDKLQKAQQQAGVLVCVSGPSGNGDALTGPLESFMRRDHPEYRLL